LQANTYDHLFQNQYPMKIGFVFPNKDRRYKTVHLGMAYLSAYAKQYHNDLVFEVLDTRVASIKETKMFF